MTTAKPEIKVIAFYKFVELEDYEEIRHPLWEYCNGKQVKGSILLAQEGLNGMLAGEPAAIDEVVTHLRSDERLSDLLTKESFSDFQPFRRMKVRLKTEIVRLGVPGINPSCQVGTYVKAADWNDLISDPEVLLIDTRNDFECKLGTFKGAVNPVTDSFSDFPEYAETRLDPDKHKKIAMFCTGGIRCEKSTSYLLSKGFEKVYHLQGGILKYLEDIPAEESMWEGECFVFDDRVTLDHDLNPGQYELCRGCWQPLDEDMKASDKYEEGISCPACYDALTDAKRASRAERNLQFKLRKERGENFPN